MTTTVNITHRNSRKSKVADTTLDTRQSAIRILSFNLGHGVDMRTAAEALERAERDGNCELVTAYATPSPNGDRTVHFFVLRQRAPVTEVS
jgi:hypothetical protein